MKANPLSFLAVCAGLLVGCAATVPKELASARVAYQRASAGPAARVAPAQLHSATQALARAERSFRVDPKSFRTRDLAYVAQRRAEIAEATASTIGSKTNQSVANSEFQTTQGQIVTKAKVDLKQANDDLAASGRIAAQTKNDLNRTRSALAASGQVVAQTKNDLNQTRSELVASDQIVAKTENDLGQTRDALAASERSGAAAAYQLSAERAARMAAESRTTSVLAALAKLAAVKEEARGMVITLSGSVLFTSDQATLLPAARLRLDEVAKVLLTTSERHLTVEGHTDSQGSEGHNLDLSQRRADAVRDYLVSRDYQADRIKALGLGEGQPVADNGSPEGRANNRRVEIVVASEPHASN